MEAKFPADFVSFSFDVTTKSYFIVQLSTREKGMVGLMQFWQENTIGGGVELTRLEEEEEEEEEDFIFFYFFVPRRLYLNCTRILSSRVVGLV